jgi:hypothetical protein
MRLRPPSEFSVTHSGAGSMAIHPGVDGCLPGGRRYAITA